jgi:N utilization substance protein B
MTEKKEARRESRRIALETCFVFLSRNEKVSINEAFDHVLCEVEEKKKDDFAKEILKSAIDNLSKIKVVIRAYAPEFPLEKIAPINRAILILGIAEMKFLATPPIVVINEYIELAKAFGEDKSGGFINGVLDKFRKNIERERESEEEK